MTTTRAQLTRAFAAAFTRQPHTLWRSPGRVNIIGEFTDFNQGLVLPMAVQFDVNVAAAPRADGIICVASIQSPSGSMEARICDLRPGIHRGWPAYPLAMAWVLREAGHPITGADILIDGHVPAGAGLSSSAALECATGAAMLALTATTLEPLELARLAQRAENDFVGVPCGIMDQYISAAAPADHALLIDTRDLSATPVTFDPHSHGLSLLIIDTHVRHSLAGSDYATRRAECEHAAAALGVSSLREASLDDLTTLTDQRLRSRARHVVTENERVRTVADNLACGDLRAIGPTLTQSHVSLRDDFQVSCPELDLAVSTALHAGALGARMTGGGFGGSAIALIDMQDCHDVVDTISAAFARSGFTPPTFTTATASTGTGPLT